MTETTAARTLYEAWVDRSNRALVALLHSDAAPALFQPERVQELQADVAKTGRQYRFWQEQARD